MAAGDVKVKQVATDLRQAQGVVVNISPPLTSDNVSSSFDGNKGVLDLVSPPPPSFDISTTAHGRNFLVCLLIFYISTLICFLVLLVWRKSFSFTFFRHVICPILINSCHDCAENTTGIVKASVPSQVSVKNSDTKPPKQQIVETVAPNKLDAPVEI